MTPEQEKIFEAQAVQQGMELEKDLGKIGAKLDEIFKIAPPMKLTPVEKEELDRLSKEIRSATGSNTPRARILTLVNKGLSA